MPEGVSLDVFGEGELRSELQSEIDKYHLPVRLLGTQKDLNKVLPEYDVFLMTSFFEGLSVALLEAMACGLPTLLSDVPVLKEIGGDEALYFDIGNPNSLVELINSILARKHNLSYLSQKGLEKVKKIGKRDNALKQLVDIYELVN